MAKQCDKAIVTSIITDSAANGAVSGTPRRLTRSDLLPLRRHLCSSISEEGTAHSSCENNGSISKQTLAHKIESINL